MPPEESTKCSALIPNDLLEKLKESGYENRAEAIRLGLECLLKESQKIQAGINKTLIENPEESPENHRDSLELAELRGKYEIIQTLLDEKDKRIEDLAGQVERLDRLTYPFKKYEVKQIGDSKKKWWMIWK